MLLKKYWKISDRQVQTSVVLADEKWFERRLKEKGSRVKGRKQNADTFAFVLYPLTLNLFMKGEAMALLSVENTVLMVIDMQGNLYESMQDKEFLPENVRKLVRGMQVFGIPVIVTEQIPEKLGPTIEP